MLAARLKNFSGEALSDFDRLGNAAAFDNKPRDIRAGPQKSPSLQGPDSNADRNLVDVPHMISPFH